MGTPVPPDWPPLDPDKYYCVTVDSFVGTIPPTPCGGGVFMQCRCCPKGDALIMYIANDWQCGGSGLCAPCWPLAGHHRIVNITGPYDTGLECNLACL